MVLDVAGACAVVRTAERAARADLIGRAGVVDHHALLAHGIADLLVLGWGSTWGSIQAAVRRVRADGKQVAHAHLVHMNPFPANLGEVLRGYRKILVPEMNLGQLSRLVRAEYLVDARTLSKVQGVPFSASEIEARILEMLDA